MSDRFPSPGIATRRPPHRLGACVFSIFILLAHLLLVSFHLVVDHHHFLPGESHSESRRIPHVVRELPSPSGNCAGHLVDDDRQDQVAHSGVPPLFLEATVPPHAGISAPVTFSARVTSGELRFGSGPSATPRSPRPPPTC